MTRFVARVCLALALVAAASSSTAHAAAARSPDILPWEIDYKSWMEDIKASVAGNAELEQKAAELQTQLDAAIAAGVPEEDRMRLLYDFLGIADSDPTFVGFTTKEATASTTTSTTTATTPATTTAAPTTPPPSSAAASYKTLASVTSLAVAVVGYALL